MRKELILCKAEIGLFDIATKIDRALFYYVKEGQNGKTQQEHGTIKPIKLTE